jgi:prepilin-type N-terminal cleavage/methylation domain-containing protein
MKHHSLLRLFPSLNSNRLRWDGFSVVEMLITISILSVISAISFNSIFSFLEQQRLRQAAIELISYLHTARARAMRESSLSGRPCEVQFTAFTTDLAPTNATRNTCNDVPGLSTLNLQASSNVRNLSVSSNQGSQEAYLLTFTRFGTLASENISSTAAVNYPLVLYLSGSATTVQRCIWIDTGLIRSGWRNPPASPNCTYNGN